ncbi:MAG: hypothetical protein ACRDTE_28665 [Pseudonocardiaceae bacterium]
MLDPDVHPGRRAWLPCPRCGDDDCPTCARGATCDRHWRYLLGNEQRRVFLQCPACHHRWWHDTGFGVGDHRPDRSRLPDFPASPGEAA